MVGLYKRHKRRKDLGRDEDGAILVAGIFVTAFLVGALYMVIGASTAMQHGELMQDSSDSAAFSVAQTHAKGMNMIALNNMIKVGALATIVAPASIAIGAQKTIDWINATEWRRRVFGWVRPFLAIVAIEASEAYAKAQGRIPRIIAAADTAQRTLINELPLIAEDLVNGRLKNTFAPPVTSFFLSPVHNLPVESETMSKMCDRMRPYAESINKRGFRSVPERLMRNKAEGYARAEFDRFCMTYGRPAMIPNDVLPGEEGYQIRAFAGGDELSTTGEKGVQVATWGAGGSDEISDIRDDLTPIAFAQAEYYYSGRTQKDEALWSMNWRARLRGFRWPGGSLASDCSRQGGPSRACAALPEYFNKMKWATIH